MKHYTNILMPYDGSNISGEALEVAKMIAKQQDAQLTVIYVHDYSTSESIWPLVTSSGDPNLLQVQTNTEVSPVPVDSPEEVTYANNVESADNIPDTMIASAKSRMSNDMNVKYEVLNGNPAKEITKYTEEHDIDLVVMGGRGLSGLRKFTMGSVSNKVSNEISCSIMIVR